MESIQNISEKLGRKKKLGGDVMTTSLRRCLRTVDLILLGTGMMIGAGIFVLTGTVVRNIAGPGTFISYILAGIAALLASLCYAELGARIPKAGSAYTYTYVGMGEFWAFIVGWNIILEHTLGTASLSRSFSASFDSLLGGAIRNGTMTHIGTMNAAEVSEYPDFFAFGVTLAVMVLIACGARITVSFNNVCTVFIVLVIVLIISAGLSKADLKFISEDMPGGFLPFGISGVFAGAGTCFYSYLGFEGIAVAGEEAKTPARSIPIAIGVSMTVVTVLYVLASLTLTLMVPYYKVDIAAPFPEAFADNGIEWARYIVAIGSLFGIITSLIGGLYALPRSVYAIASDGLFFKWFAYIHPKTKVPLRAILFFGTVSALFGFLFDIETLVEFLSIGTLAGFTIVAANVLILRYQPHKESERKTQMSNYHTCNGDTKPLLVTELNHREAGMIKSSCQNVPLLRRMKPGQASILAVFWLVASLFAFCALLVHGYNYVSGHVWWAILLITIFGLGIAGSLTVLLMHNQNSYFETFKVPLVPFSPALSMLLNIGMMMNLTGGTWIRFVIWTALGLLVYFGYGIRNSSENRPLSSQGHEMSYSQETVNNGHAYMHLEKQ